MTKLSDTQLIVLSNASQRESRLALPLPMNLKGGAAQKVVTALLKHGMIEEVDANMSLGEDIWRETGDGHGVTLAITAAGLDAIGVEQDAPEDAPTGTDSAPVQDAAPDAATTTDTAPTTPTARKPRTDTKQAQMIAMLQKTEGATIEEMATELGWQRHTVRGAMAGALKKKLGLEITSEKIDQRGRVYRTQDEA